MSRWQNREWKRKNRKPKFKKQYRTSDERDRAKSKKLRKLRRDKERRLGIPMDIQ